MGELSKLKGLGPKSEQQLNAIGISTKAQLAALGPIAAFIKLKKESNSQPSLNFLYAMVGALQDEHWTQIARKEKLQLIMALEGYAELEKILQAEGVELKM